MTSNAVTPAGMVIRPHGVVSHAVGEGRRGGGEVGAGGGGVARQHERQGHRLRGRSGQGDGLGKVAAFGGAARPDRADGGVGGVVDGAAPLTPPTVRVVVSLPSSRASTVVG